MRSFLTFRRLGLALALLLVLSLVFVKQSEGSSTRTVTAHFPRAVSIFVGSDVRVLGVTVGTVRSVTPEGASVRVVMEYDDTVQLPADATAAIVTPTLVADRFVQLSAYSGGEVMPDDGDIAMPETMVPVELDRIYASLSDLLKTLGPNGLNADGTLNHLVTAGAETLDGQGARANRMLRNLAEAASTFSHSSGDLFDTVSQLADFTTTLAESDDLVNAFIADLADVSGQLDAERDELQGTLSAVADAVGVVEGFVKDNRAALARDVRKLTRVTSTIASERDSLDTALDVAPVAMGNLFLAFNTESGSIGSRIGVTGNTWDADGFLCSIVQQSDLPKVSKTLACQLFKQLLEPVENQLPSIPPAQGRVAPGSKVSAPRASGRAPAPETTYGATGPVSLADLVGGAP